MLRMIFSNERTKQVAAASAGGGNLPAVQRVCAGTAYKDAFGRPRYYQEVNYGDPRQNDMRKLGGLRWDSPSSKTSTSTRPTTVGDMRPCKSSPSLLSMSATSPKAAHNSTFGGKTFKPESPTNAMQFTLSEIVPKEDGFKTMASTNGSASFGKVPVHMRTKDNLQLTNSLKLKLRSFESKLSSLQMNEISCKRRVEEMAEILKEAEDQWKADKFELATVKGNIGVLIKEKEAEQEELNAAVERLKANADVKGRAAYDIQQLTKARVECLSEDIPKIDKEIQFKRNRQQATERKIQWSGAKKNQADFNRQNATIEFNALHAEIGQMILKKKEVEGEMDSLFDRGMKIRTVKKPDEGGDSMPFLTGIKNLLGGFGTSIHDKSGLGAISGEVCRHNVLRSRFGQWARYVHHNNRKRVLQSQNEFFRIIIIPQIGTKATISLRVSAHTITRELKALLATKLKLPKVMKEGAKVEEPKISGTQFTLIHLGKELIDETTLKDSGIMNNSSIRMMFLL